MFSQVHAAAWRQGGIPLDVGEPLSGAITNDAFRQIYTFTGQANEVVALRMTRASGDLDPYLLLTDERGNILALSDDDGPGTDATIEFKRIPEDGRYFVVATRFGQEHGSTSGDYTLLLERVGGSTPENAVLQYGDRALGRITNDAPLMFYFIRAQRGDMITITMRRTSGNLDPHLDLATADGAVLFSNDDDANAEGTLDAGITNYTIYESGIYLIVATRFGREAGDTEGSYVLAVTQTPPDELGASPETARLLDYGSTLTGTIDEETPARYYRFEARRGEVITVAVSWASGNLNPLVKLLDENLVVLASDDNGGDNTDARIAAYTAPSSGMYYIVATRFGEQTGQTQGTFTIELNGRPGIVGGQALEIGYGSTVSGQIDAQTLEEEYVFLGQQGDEVEIWMQRASGDLDALVTLYDSERKQIAFDDDSGGEKDALIKDFVLPRDDMYVVVASRYERDTGTTSGAYILSLKLVRPGR